MQNTEEAKKRLSKRIKKREDKKSKKMKVDGAHVKELERIIRKKNK